MSVRRRSLAHRLYNGETSFDFVGRRRVWFAMSGTIILIGLAFLGLRGLNLGIDFRGGTSWEVTAPHTTLAQARSAVEAAGLVDPTVQQIGNNGYRIEAYVKGQNGGTNTALETRVTDALAKLGHTSTSAVSVNDVGPSWGSEITGKAIRALIFFVLAIILYLSIRFEPKMALAAIIAVFHDILVTVGVYAIFNFSVTPDTVIAFLTILGYSLYDTVVVFDKVQENTRGL
ncbi:MAG TPA: protein translocase subunit SecF, partial [Acidimicrobiales bacterium]|nr:protein translocase subunit SecF [Acidimicrobiales bacterium]